MVLEEADKCGVLWEIIPFTSMFKLSYLDSTKFFHGQTPSETTEYASYCCENKDVANSILSDVGISISKGHLLKYTDSHKDRKMLFNQLEKPLVVKPANSQQGTNVYTNIKTYNKYATSIKNIYARHSRRKVDILVEEMFIGDEYRILATQDKILSVIKRIAANVVGDGVSTISELAGIKNQDPIRLEMSTYKGITIDKNVILFLKKQGFKPSTILSKGERVFLRNQGPLDISLGGDTIDVTDMIHPSVEKIVKKIMKSMPGLALTGIDYMTKDISASQTKHNYRVIEINASPSLDWNEFPLEGPRRRIAYEFLKIMFPNLNVN
jgi:glutamate--cysteine ligase